MSEQEASAERDIIACAKQNSDVGRDDRIADLLAIIDRLSRQPEAEPVAWQIKYHRDPRWYLTKEPPREDAPYEALRPLYISPRLDREKVARAIRHCCHQYSTIDVDALADSIMREMR